MPILPGVRFRRQEPRRGRLMPPQLRARAERKRRRHPVLRVLGDLDQALLRTMRTRGHHEPLETAMKGLGAIGELAAVWAAIGVAGAAADGSRRGRWAAAAAVGPAAVGVNYVVKVAVGRQRPLIEGHPALAKAPTKLSFPSAHATSSLAGATALGRVEPRARPALYALASGVCLSRPYLGMHYPSDVLAGAVLGLALGALVPGPGRPGAEERLLDLATQTREGATRADGSNGSERSRAGEPASPGAAA